MEVNQGHLYWVALASPDGAEVGIAHPHVVIQDDVLNHSRLQTVVVCALSTNLKRANLPGNVLLDPGEGGLPKQSIVLVSQVSTVNKADLGECIGALSRERVQQILAGMRLLQRMAGRNETVE